MRGFQVRGQGVELVPQCLRPDLEAQARHLSRLSGQGQMVRILGDGHRDCEVHGIPPARDELRRAEGRLNARATPAAVLLPFMADQPKGSLDDVDLLGGLELIRPLTKLSPALGADLVRLIESMNHVDDRQLGLRRGAMAMARVAPRSQRFRWQSVSLTRRRRARGCGGRVVL